MPPISATGKASGFTLLEVLLVVVILGLLAVTVSLTVPDSRQRQLRADAEFLRAQFSLASEEAIHLGQDLGLVVARDHYEFRRRAGNQWLALDPESPLEARTLVEGSRLELHRDGVSLSLAAEAGDAEPQILFLSDGQVTPFVLSLRHPELKQARRLEVDLLGGVRLAAAGSEG